MDNEDRRDNDKPEVAEAYCFRCKAKKPVRNATETRMRNGRMALTGLCVTCGGKVFKILPSGVERLRMKDEG